MPHAKLSSAGNMHGGRPRNSPGLRRGQTVWPLIRRMHWIGSKTAGSRGFGHLPHPGLS